MKIYKTLAYVAALAFLFNACNKTEPQPSDSQPETSPSQNTEARTITCTWFQGSYKGDGRFVLKMSDKTPLGQGVWATESAVCILEVQAPKPFDPDAAALTPGEYSLGSGISETQSLLLTTTKSGAVFGEYLFESAALTVTSNDITLTGQTNDGLQCTVCYRGVLEFENESSDPKPLYPVTSPVTTTFTEAGATYYTTDDKGVSNFLLSFTDMTRNSGGQLVPPGYLFNIDIYGTLTDSHELGEGTFSIDTQYTYAAGTYTGGHVLDYYGTLIPGGAYLTQATIENNSVVLKYGFITGGTVTVKKSGSAYSVSFDLEMEGGYPLKASYNGPIPVTDRYSDDDDDDNSEDSDEPLSTLTGDYTLSFTGPVEAEARCYGNYYSSLSNNWILWVMPTGSTAGRDAIHIELCTEPDAFDGNFPTGHYSIDFDKVYRPGYLIPGYYQDGYSATYFITLDSKGTSMAQHAPAWGGYLDVSKSGSNYTLIFDFEDDATPSHHFKGSYTGPMTVSDYRQQE